MQKQKPKKTVQSIYIDEEMREKLRTKAVKENRNLSNVVNNILKQFFDGENK